MVTLLILAACQTSPGPKIDPPSTDAPASHDPGEFEGAGDASDTVQMGALALLRRTSLDLRGRLPSADELAAVEADPDAVDAIIDTMVYDDAFGERVRDLWAPIYQTRLDYWTVDAADYGLSDSAGFAAAVGEEPLMILSQIAENDLPYTELVTGDWTMSNELLGAAWPLDYPGDGSGWTQTHYTDDRPAAGVLSTNGLWWRYMSTESNANRGRANALSKLLLCTDYLSKPIEFDRNVNLLDGDAVNEALQTNAGCVACHHSLDPFASYLWGFYYYDIYSALDTSLYHGEREYLYSSETGVNPGYYGEPGYTLHDLGQQIASDSRFPECFARQAFTQLMGRDYELEDTQQVVNLRERFIEEGLTMRPVLRAVVDLPGYRAGTTVGGDPEYRKMMGPELMAGAIEDLTGYRFSYYGYDMMTTDTYGLRTLAGGVDGQFVTRPAPEATATMLLVHERLAQAAASYVVDADMDDPDSARLFTEVHFTETPESGRDAMVAEIQLLHWRLYGHRVEADGQEVEANLALWQELYDADGDIEDAWAGLLAVLLRDPDFLYY